MSLVTDIGQQIMNRWTVSSGLPDGLLDLYPGAAAGYSLRRLRKAQTQCLFLRRDNDDATTDIGFLANGNLDAQSIIDFCGGANGYVRTWYDQSGNSNDLVQTTLSAQPQIFDGSSVLNTEFGRPQIDFDGLNDSLGVNVAVEAFTSQSQISSFLVGGDIGGTANVRILSLQKGSSDQDAVFFFRNRDTRSVSFIRGTAGEEATVLIVIPQDFSPRQNSVFANRISGELDAAINGGAISNDAKGSPFTLSDLDFLYLGSLNGNDELYDGGISEAIIYKDDKFSDRAAIEADQIAYWNIT
jgi:hypothetical protein